LHHKGFCGEVQRNPLWCKALAMLSDGTYDAFVLDAEAVPDGGTGAVRVELTITSGPSKGEVVSVRGHIGGGDPLDLLGIPATLVVEDGTPRLRIDS